MRAIICTLLFIGFDVVTGVMKAFSEKSFNSTKMREGGMRKLAEIVSLIGSMLLEGALDEIHFGIDLPLLNVVSLYICVMELISIIENLCIVNPLLSSLFAPYLEKLKNLNGDNKE